VQLYPTFVQFHPDEETALFKNTRAAHQPGSVTSRMWGKDTNLSKGGGGGGGPVIKYRTIWGCLT